MTATTQKRRKNMNELIRNRHSVRRYLEQEVEQEKVENILRAGMQAPSAKRQQAWHFIVVRDPETKAALSEMSPFAHMIKFAPVVIVTLCDLDVADQFGWWVQDMAACTENLLLQAADEGLGACWCGFYPYADRVEPIKELFQLPRSMMPFSVVTLGYPAKEAKFEDRWQPDRVHYEKF